MKLGKIQAPQIRWSMHDISSYKREHGDLELVSTRISSFVEVCIWDSLISNVDIVPISINLMFNNNTFGEVKTSWT